jgi:hypothetical protein
MSATTNAPTATGPAKIAVSNKNSVPRETYQDETHPRSDLYRRHFNLDWNILDDWIVLRPTHQRDLWDAPTPVSSDETKIILDKLSEL